MTEKQPTEDVRQLDDKRSGKKPSPFDRVKAVRSKRMGPVTVQPERGRAFTVSAAARKTVAVFIATYADTMTGRCRVKLKTLAGDTEMHRITVWRVLRSFETQGLLRWEDGEWFTFDLEALGRLPDWRDEARKCHSVRTGRHSVSTAHVAPRNSDVAPRNSDVAPRNSDLELSINRPPNRPPTTRVTSRTEEPVSVERVQLPDEASKNRSPQALAQPVVEDPSIEGSVRVRQQHRDEGGWGFEHRVVQATRTTGCPYCPSNIIPGENIAPSPEGHEYGNRWLHVACAVPVWKAYLLDQLEGSPTNPTRFGGDTWNELAPRLRRLGCADDVRRIEHDKRSGKWPNNAYRDPSYNPASYNPESFSTVTRSSAA